MAGSRTSSRLDPSSARARRHRQPGAACEAPADRRLPGRRPEGAYWGIRTQIAEYGLVTRSPARSIGRSSWPDSDTAEVDGRDPPGAAHQLGLAVCRAAVRKYVDTAIAPPLGFPYPSAGVGWTVGWLPSPPMAAGESRAPLATGRARTWRRIPFSSSTRSSEARSGSSSLPGPRSTTAAGSASAGRRGCSVPERGALEAFLAEHRRPAGLARSLRIGDAFAVRVIADAFTDVGEELAAQTRLEPLLKPVAWIRAAGPRRQRRGPRSREGGVLRRGHTDPDAGGVRRARRPHRREGDLMAVPTPVPAAALTPGDFIGNCEPADLVYFPAQRRGRRRAARPAAGGTGRDAAGPCRRRGHDRQASGAPRSACGHAAPPPARRSHLRRHRDAPARGPHRRHAGVPQSVGSLVREFWEPGYYHPSVSYMETMRAMEDQPSIQHSQPTSGSATLPRAGVRVVRRSRRRSGCAIRFDSYGVEHRTNWLGSR